MFDSCFRFAPQLAALVVAAATTLVAAPFVGTSSGIVTSTAAGNGFGFILVNQFDPARCGCAEALAEGDSSHSFTFTREGIASSVLRLDINLTMLGDGTGFGNPNSFPIIDIGTSVGFEFGGGIDYVRDPNNDVHKAKLVATGRTHKGQQVVPVTHEPPAPQPATAIGTASHSAGPYGIEPVKSTSWGVRNQLFMSRNGGAFQLLDDYSATIQNGALQTNGIPADAVEVDPLNPNNVSFDMIRSLSIDLPLSAATETFEFRRVSSAFLITEHLECVPEPQTWALVMPALLLFYKVRKRRLN